MMTHQKIGVQFSWPSVDIGEHSDNFFLGAWHPTRTLLVECQTKHRPVVSLQNRNWFLLSARSPFPPEKGLIHAGLTPGNAIAFRGYVVPSLHSYSSSDRLSTYWDKHLNREHNGIFSLARISESGHQLSLMVDALGIGALYYRRVGSMVLFSTNPRYLAVLDEQANLTAWRSLLDTSFILGDETLSQQVCRVPAGTALSFTENKMETITWFHLRSLPDGAVPANDTSLKDVEVCFQEAMDRCLGLNTGTVSLPLSSGYDSRRMLAALVLRRTQFQAITCRVYQKEHRDLDARFASSMAKEFGFPHLVVEAQHFDQYVNDDRARRVLVDAETHDHTWALRVMKALPDQSSLFFDGVGGDVLGDPVGWKVHLGLDITTRSPHEDINLIATHSITSVLDTFLASTIWPKTEDLREQLTSLLIGLLPRNNIAEIAFLLLRQRRTIAPWSQQLLPPGHVAVYPYFDLDYLRLLLGYSPESKHGIKFQRACLKEFWPQFFQFPGNRDIPFDVPPGSPHLHHERSLHCYQSMENDLVAEGKISMLAHLLSLKGRLGMEVLKRNRPLGARALWYLQPLAELVWRHATSRPCWTITQGS